MPDPTTASGPKLVFIIRHGEKPGDPAVDNDADGPSLSTRGHERAAALAINIPATLPKPDFLLATQQSKHSNRPVETITPLAKALGLEINSKHGDDDYAIVANDILHHPKYAGKNVFICWHHGKIPKLAEALGVSNPINPWPGNVFDRVWKIDYSKGSQPFKIFPRCYSSGTRVHSKRGSGLCL